MYCYHELECCGIDHLGRMLTYYDLFSPRHSKTRCAVKEGRCLGQVNVATDAVGFGV